MANFTEPAKQIPQRYAAVIGYDATPPGRFAKAVAVKRADNTTALVGSGLDAPIILHELEAAEADLRLHGFLTERNAYTGDILGQTQARALALAATL